jgi:flagellar FliJ protein
MPKESRYDRILRVRTLQLGQVRAEEGRARARVEHEQALRERINQLSANVAPSREQSTATGLIAAQRIAVAEQGLTAAAEATREAKRDQSAIEKLIARGDAEAAIKALRALEALPPTGKNRHDLC